MAGKRTDETKKARETCEPAPYAAEIEKHLPGERIVSAHRASISSIKDGEREPRNKSSANMFKNMGYFVITPDHFAFLVDKRNFWIVMVVMAVIAIIFSIATLLSNFSIEGILLVVIVLILLVIAEAFIYSEQASSGFLLFHREKTKVHVSPESQEILLDDTDYEKMQFLARKRAFRIKIEEGKMPALNDTESSAG